MEREIADYIYKSFEALTKNGVEPEEALETIKSDVKCDFDKEYSVGTIQHYASRTFDAIRKTLEKYHQSEKHREALRRRNKSERYKEYHRRYRQLEKCKEKRKRRAQQKQKEKLRKTNPDLFEFREYMKRFENGERIEIKPENRYVKVLTTFGRYDSSVTGKNLSRDIGVNTVKVELRVLNIHGLIKHDTYKKTIITQKGRKFLESVIKPSIERKITI